MIDFDVDRSGWGATAPRQYRAAHTATSLEIHHTAIPNYATWKENGALETLQNIQRYHIVQKGWNDIFYNGIVDPRGVVYEGRPVASDGVFKLCFIGNYEDQDNLTDAAGHALRKAMSLFPGDVTWHAKRGAGTKYASSCPGSDMIAAIERILQEPTKEDTTMTIEEATLVVEMLYGKFLGRGSDPGGLAFWAGELADGSRTVPEISLEFLGVQVAGISAAAEAAGARSDIGFDIEAAREVFYAELRKLSAQG